MWATCWGMADASGADSKAGQGGGSVRKEGQQQERTARGKARAVKCSTFFRVKNGRIAALLTTVGALRAMGGALREQLFFRQHKERQQPWQRR